jgi:hypothetical protein
MMPKKKEQITMERRVRGDHVLLKVRSEGGQTITAHADMVTRKGTAMLGKIGKGIGAVFRDKLNLQIELGIKTFLFLTTREGWNGPFVTYRCVLQGVHPTLDVDKKTLVPSYYAHETLNIKTWFEIASIERLTPEEMNRIFVVSSGREIMGVVNTSGTIFQVGVHK